MCLRVARHVQSPIDSSAKWGRFPIWHLSFPLRPTRWRPSGPSQRRLVRKISCCCCQASSSLPHMSCRRANWREKSPLRHWNCCKLSPALPKREPSKERFLQAPLWAPPEEGPCLLLAHRGSGAVPSLGPQSVSKPTLTNCSLPISILGYRSSSARTYVTLLGSSALRLAMKA